jgi:hypothetical protein
MKKVLFIFIALMCAIATAMAQPAGAIYCPDSTDVVYAVELNLETSCFLDWDDNPTEIGYFIEDLDDPDNFGCSFPGDEPADGQLGFPRVTNDSTTYADFPAYGLQSQAVCMTPGNKHRMWLFFHERCTEDENFNDQVIINTFDLSSDTISFRAINSPGDYTTINTSMYRGAKVFDFIAPSANPVVFEQILADLNGDCVVNSADLGIILTQFGQRCE